MHSFSLATKIYMGENSLSSVLKDSRKVFIVTDKFMHTSGKVKYITDYLDSIGAQNKIFSDIHPDPDIDTVVSGIKELIEFGADSMVALGGGSAIDTAKAIRYFYHLQNKEQKDECLFVVLPTTSGTGSEVSSYAVITDTRKQIKYPLDDEGLLPDVAILDAHLVLTVPPKVTADTGVDVLTHAIESFVSVNHSDFSDAMAEKAIKLICRYLYRAYTKPDDLEARQFVHDAATMAGVAFNNAGLGMNHAMAHALGAKFHIPHGRACGIFLPYVMNYNAGCSSSLSPTAERYAEIAAILNLDKSGVRQGALSAIRAVRNLLNKLQIPSSIKDAGIDRREFENMLESMVDAALADATMATTPEKCTKEQMTLLFRAVYNGSL
jgi:1-propanol dehydrogenase